MLTIEPDASQPLCRPRTGACIMAQFGDGLIVVYRAFWLAIGCLPAELRSCGDVFSCSGMKSIKPNLLWTPYRS